MHFIRRLGNAVVCGVFSFADNACIKQAFHSHLSGEGEESGVFVAGSYFWTLRMGLKMIISNKFLGDAILGSV